jgi:hypothetical protein
MSQSRLATEIRQQTRRFVDGEMSLREYRVWFNDADSRANRGRPSGRVDSRLAALTDEIQDILSDYDSGFIDAERLKAALSVRSAMLRGDVILAARGTADGFLYRHPASVFVVTAEFVPA